MTLKEQLAAGWREHQERLFVLPHPRRPEFEVVAASVVDGDRIRVLASQSDKQKKPAWWVNAVLLAEQTREIRLNGDALVDGDGEPATFRTVAVMEHFNAATVAECVRAAYESDIALAKVVEALLAQSGFDDEVDVEPLDPTAAG